MMTHSFAVESPRILPRSARSDMLSRGAVAATDVVGVAAAGVAAPGATEESFAFAAASERAHATTNIVAARVRSRLYGMRRGVRSDCRRCVVRKLGGVRHGH